ncbi:MAG: metallopeptidase TldD-related protein [bacterium]
MRETFDRLSDHLSGLLRGGEIFTCCFSGEDSDFVRFNKSAVRQAGSVRQMMLRVELISEKRHAQSNLTLSGDLKEDQTRMARSLEQLREILPALPEDPHLIYATEISSSERRDESHLPSSDESVDAILEAGRGKDLVGIYAAGGIHAGFANSFGQRNWHSSFSFHLDWTFYHQGDKAVKSRYAGSQWDAGKFGDIVRRAEDQLDVLARTPKSLSRGNYRVYLSPAALAEFVGTVAMRGFGLRARRTKQSSLLKMAEEGRRLHPSVSLRENTRDGLSPEFQEQGFPKPSRIPLVEAGSLAECLVSPRSAKEWDTLPNGASEREAPESLDMEPGDISSSEILNKLEKGVYVGDLWYLNFSDLPACRMTGLTRFASFWVEDGEIKAPVQVMRFDETVYRVLGENLIGLTREREFIPDSGTYGSRSTRSSRVPGALVEDFAFTL